LIERAAGHMLVERLAGLGGLGCSIRLGWVLFGELVGGCLLAVGSWGQISVPKLFAWKIDPLFLLLFSYWAVGAGQVQLADTHGRKHFRQLIVYVLYYCTAVLTFHDMRDNTS
jgi:hypothetical protein